MKNIIWSNYNLDIEDWRADLQEYYPDYTEDELIEEMHYTNNEYIEDERMNLNIQLSQEIIAIADIGRWNGRRGGYKIIESGNIADCLYSECEYGEWYIDEYGEFNCRESHHDGTNYITYRTFRDNITDEQREKLLDALWKGEADQTLIDKYTKRIGPEICKVYGWKYQRKYLVA